MNLQQNVEEQLPPDTTLQVFHRQLKIPIPIYLEAVSEYTDPWEERAYQFFVQKYLEELNDSGIVGMVRQERNESHVLLDAAVRYTRKNTQ